MGNIFLFFGCFMLAYMTILTALVESFLEARPYAAALIVLACITADKVVNK